MSLPKIIPQLESFALQLAKIKEQERRTIKGKRTAFWPSEASIEDPVTKKIYGKCHRSLFWSFKNEPESNPLDGRGLRTVESGRYFEEMMVDVLKNMGYWDAVRNETEKKFYNEDLNISGEVDGILIVNGQSFGIEFKTIYGYWARKEVFVQKKPKIEHLLQTALYLYHFYPMPFKILYGTRDSQELKEFDLELKDRNVLYVDGRYSSPIPITIDAIRNRFERFQGFLDKNELPPPDYSVLGLTNEELQRELDAGNLKKIEATNFLKGRKIIKIPWECSFCRYYYKCQKLEQEKRNPQIAFNDLKVYKNEKGQQDQKNKKTTS